MHTPTSSHRRSVLRTPALLAAFSLTGFLMVGCEQPEEVRAYDAPKPPTAAQVVANAQPTPNSFENLAPSVPVAAPAAAPEAPPVAPKAAGGPSWDVPKGWTELPGSAMRYASLRVSAENPEVQLTVIPLPPQPVLENVNRWEGQIGAPHTPADKLKDVVKKVELGGGATAHVVDLSGPGAAAGGPKQRILGAMVEHEGRMWFFKLMGADSIVGPQKENFDAFVKSVRFGEKKAQADAPAAGPVLATAVQGNAADLVQVQAPAAEASPAAAAAAEQEKISKYQAPASWEEDKTPRPLRLLTFRVKEADKSGEVSVLRLGKDNIGPLLENINRWRSQVGAAPVASVNEADIPKVTIAGKEAMLFELGGPDDKNPTKRMLLAMAPRGEDVYFYKLLGDAALVAGQKEAFSQFLKSVEFGK